MTDYTLGDTCYFMFTTRKFSTGAPFTLAGTPVISAYPSNSTTQITAGVSLGVDHDAVTGLNLVTVVATGGNGFAAGTDYHLVITTGTVDSVSVVGEVVGRFTLQRSAAAVDLANATDGLGAIKTETASIQADTNDIQTRIPAALVSGRIDASVGAMATDVLTSTALATSAVTEIQSGLATAAALTIVDDFLDTEIAAIKAKTDNLPAAPAAVSDIPSATTIADAILDRNLATGADSGSPTVRTVRQALRFLRNKWAVSAGTLTVYKEDDTTASWTATVTGDAAADPIIGSDPA